jgi:hypothetical protein
MKSSATLKFLTLFFILASFSANAGHGKREKVIDFEDEVVEGMNKKPLDSLSQISEGNKKRHKPHLYRKRIGFRPETNDTLHWLRYTQ